MTNDFCGFLYKKVNPPLDTSVSFRNCKTWSKTNVDDIDENTSVTYISSSRRNHLSNTCEQRHWQKHDHQSECVFLHTVW